MLRTQHLHAGWIKHFSDDIVEDFLDDGSEQLVARDLPGMQIDAGQLRVVIQHLFKVSCTIQYAWTDGINPISAGFCLLTWRFSLSLCRLGDTW